MTHDLSLPDPLLSLLRQLWRDPRLLVVLAALARTPGPLTARQLAELVCAAPETVSLKLKTLSRMGLVSRPKVRGGWFLTRDGWGFMFTPPNPYLPDSSSSLTLIDKYIEVEERGVNAEIPPVNGQLTRKIRINPEVIAELQRNGISLTDKVVRIASRDYITPQYIYAHARRLRRLKKFSPGLLITVLDSHDELTREDRIDRRDYEFYLEHHRDGYG